MEEEESELVEPLAPVFQFCRTSADSKISEDGYIYSGVGSPAVATSPGSLVLLPATTLSPALRCGGSSENPQERRSLQFFRLETIPGIGGYFGISTWKLVLQACETQPIVRQAAIALGALHETMSLQSSCGDTSKQLETTFPLKQYGKALLAIREYLSTAKDPKLEVVLMCSLICISIEVMQNNWLNASVHLENSLHLLQAKSSREMFNTDIDPDISLSFSHLDLHASKFQGMRSPAMVHKNEFIMPGRFSSIVQAKDALANLVTRLWAFTRSTAEEYKYRKLQPVPPDAVAAGEKLIEGFVAWKDRFNKFLHRSTSKFSRQEQYIIDVLTINHRTDYIEAATCIHPEAMIFGSCSRVPFFRFQIVPRSASSYPRFS